MHQKTGEDFGAQVLVKVAAPEDGRSPPRLVGHLLIYLQISRRAEGRPAAGISVS
jgi:hypothetical protein